MNDTFMKEKPVFPLLTSMALPMVASMLVSALYNIVDSLYVARISEEAMTALSLVYPVQNFINAVAIGFSIGISALISLHLGAGNQEKADTAATHGMVLSLLHGIIASVAGIAVIPRFLRSFTTDETVIALGLTYARIAFLFSVIIMAAMAFEKIFQAVGCMKITMAGLSLGSVCNIILDPLLIFGIGPFPRMEVAGAALATVTGQICGALLALMFNLRKNTDVHFQLKNLRPSAPVIGGIYSVGLPSIAMQSIGSVMVFGMNKILISFTEAATAVFGAYFKLQSFIFMPIFGLNNAMVPIISYNYGAGKPERFRRTIRLSAVTAIAIMCVGLAFFEVIPGTLLGLFSPSEEMLTIGRTALRIIGLTFPLAGFCIVSGSVFQALGTPFYSLIVSVCRQICVLLPVAYLLSLTGRLELVWWSFPIAELVSLTLSAIFLRRTLRAAGERLSQK